MGIIPSFPEPSTFNVLTPRHAMLPPGLGGCSVPPQLMGARVYASRAFSEISYPMDRRTSTPCSPHPTLSVLLGQGALVSRPPSDAMNQFSLSPSPQVLASDPGHRERPIPQFSLCPRHLLMPMPPSSVYAQVLCPPVLDTPDVHAPALSVLPGVLLCASVHPTDAMYQVLPRPLRPLARLSLDPVLRCQAPGVWPPFRPSLAKVGERRLPGP